ELLLCHRMSLQGQECGDLILISAKSSIYSTKPLLLCHRMSLQGQECGDLILISAKSSIYSTKPFHLVRNY
ncbi:hypothetical protein F9C28_19310, partial [Shimwellia pseudoproteus]|nr:hypothetical protein [Shimwellia pseudoproteus]